MIWRILVLFLVLPSLAIAQGRDWQLETHKTDAAFGAVLTTSTQRMTIYCGTVLSDDTSLNEELAYPGPDHFYFVSPEWVAGKYTPASNGEQTITAFSGERDATFPPFYFDDLGGAGWVSRVPFDHPIIDMVMQGQEVGIIPELAFETYLYADNFAQGLTAMMAHCGGRSDATQAATVQSGNIDPALFGLIQTQAFAQCQATYDLPPSAYTLADVTDDGIDDVIVNFGYLKCTAGLFANSPVSLACAGGMCRHDIYSAQSATPIILYANQITPAPDRVGDIHLLMDNPSCAAMGAATGCKARMRWMSQTFASVGLE